MKPVQQFVEDALYGPNGFYETGGRAGRRGASFVTSPEVGPLFGAVVANALDGWWRVAGEPNEWVVVDAGAGPGTLARTVRAAAPRCGDALRLVSVERSGAQRALHRPVAPDSSAPELPDQADVILANELLDNLPFGLIARTDGGWSPVCVVDDHLDLAGGPMAPVADAAASWVLDARRRLRPGGRLVCFDYADTTAALTERPWTDWVRAFAGHERIEHPFAAAGSRDITVVVPHDQLPPPDRSTTQAAWLVDHGIDDLVAAGRAHWQAHAAAPDVAALAMRSRVNEADALLDPAGLGAFWVGEWLA